MNDTHNDTNRLVDNLPAVDTEASTLVPVLAEADGVVILGDNVDGEHVTAGEVIGYVQTDEDA